MSKLLDQVSILRNKSPIIPETKNPTNVKLSICNFFYQIWLFKEYYYNNCKRKK
jgi:hypothetical protein